MGRDNRTSYRDAANDTGLCALFSVAKILKVFRRDERVLA